MKGNKKLRNLLKDERGSLYLVAIAFITIIIGGIAYTVSYFIYNNFYAAIQPQLNLTSTGTDSVAFAVNLWDSIPFLIMVVIAFYLYTNFQRSESGQP
ncbi:MAG: hypothetical protein ABIH76_07260 [Candidatus Bathyarchaeota archaeon]